MASSWIAQLVEQGEYAGCCCCQHYLWPSLSFLTFSSFYTVKSYEIPNASASIHSKVSYGGWSTLRKSMHYCQYTTCFHALLMKTEMILLLHSIGAFHYLNALPSVSLFPILLPREFRFYSLHCHRHYSTTTITCEHVRDGHAGRCTLLCTMSASIVGRKFASNLQATAPPLLLLL